ncbi:hypothetical protein Pcinc_006162 [Petrolisthes cinctipes]|uniref:Uncharacterized protein n=2 Tax=Petrolisthes cinctipes TaxID=88211 RepID=A0AAE1GBY5_PETCI|nr:hypothetical protein Pcinc_006162 [Petrolisthes cinctipes]
MVWVLYDVTARLSDLDEKKHQWSSLSPASLTNAHEWLKSPSSWTPTHTEHDDDDSVHDHHTDDHNKVDHYDKKGIYSYPTHDKFEDDNHNDGYLSHSTHGSFDGKKGNYRTTESLNGSPVYPGHNSEVDSETDDDEFGETRRRPDVYQECFGLHVVTADDFGHCGRNDNDSDDASFQGSGWECVLLEAVGESEDCGSLDQSVGESHDDCGSMEESQESSDQSVGESEEDHVVVDFNVRETEEDYVLTDQTLSVIGCSDNLSLPHTYNLNREITCLNQTINNGIVDHIYENQTEEHEYVNQTMRHASHYEIFFKQSVREALDCDEYEDETHENYQAVRETDDYELLSQTVSGVVCDYDNRDPTTLNYRHTNQTVDATGFDYECGDQTVDGIGFDYECGDQTVDYKHTNQIDRETGHYEFLSQTVSGTWASGGDERGELPTVADEEIVPGVRWSGLCGLDGVPTYLASLWNPHEDATDASLTSDFTSSSSTSSLSSSSSSFFGSDSSENETSLDASSFASLKERLVSCLWCFRSNPNQQQNNENQKQEELDEAPKSTKCSTCCNGDHCPANPSKMTWNRTWLCFTWHYSSPITSVTQKPCRCSVRLPRLKGRRLKLPINTRLKLVSTKHYTLPRRHLKLPPRPQLKLPYRLRVVLPSALRIRWALRHRISASKAGLRRVRKLRRPLAKLTLRMPVRSRKVDLPKTMTSTLDQCPDPATLTAHHTPATNHHTHTPASPDSHANSPPTSEFSVPSRTPSPLQSQTSSATPSSVSSSPPSTPPPPSPRHASHLLPPAYVAAVPLRNLTPTSVSPTPTHSSEASSSSPTPTSPSLSPPTTPTSPPFLSPSSTPTTSYPTPSTSCSTPSTTSTPTTAPPAPSSSSTSRHGLSLSELIRYLPILTLKRLVKDLTTYLTDPHYRLAERKKNEGNELYKAKDYREALKLYTQAIGTVGGVVFVSCSTGSWFRLVM